MLFSRNVAIIVPLMFNEVTFQQLIRQIKTSIGPQSVVANTGAF